MDRSRSAVSGKRAVARSRLKWGIVFFASLGLSLALLGAAWHPFSPFALGVWVEHVVPLFLGGQRLTAFTSATLTSVLLPIIAGMVYGLPLATLISRERGSSTPPSALSFIPVIATALTGTTTGLVRLQALGHGAGFWNAASIAATVLFGVVLIATARHARRSDLQGNRAMKLVITTTSCAGFCMASYLLLPGGLLFLVVAYSAFPLAYRSNAMRGSEGAGGHL